jgi:hypothetical protein
MTRRQLFYLLQVNFPGETGRYFSKKKYLPASPLPRFEELKDKLPAPIYDAEPIWVDVYWKAWELGFRNFYEPTAANGFVSRFIDAAFSKNIFLWDTCFMTMFCNYAHPLIPGICSLDNFYCKQYPDGEISREIQRDTGEEYPPWLNRENAPLFSRWGYRERKAVPVKYVDRAAPTPNPAVTLDALDHPIMAWAEMESYRITGDQARLELVWEPLKRYFLALQKYLLQGNGLFMTDWASMDNSPRNPWLEGGGTGVDVSSEMVLFAHDMARMARILGRHSETAWFEGEAASTARQINRLMWDDARRFYFDLSVDGKRGPSRTIAAYWTLLARVAGRSQAVALVQELKNPQTFGRRNAVATCSASEADFNPHGGYWRGAVWPPTTTMVIRGLENYGYRDLAREIAFNHLRLVGAVFKNTGTIWENYAPDADEPGKPAKKDFVGWSGIGPIMYLLEYGVGLEPDAGSNQLLWRIPGKFRVGCERFRFNGHVVSLVAEPGKDRANRMSVRVDSDSEFRLHLQFGRKTKMAQIVAGTHKFSLEA